MNWVEKVEKVKGELVQDTQAFLQIKSVLEEETASEGAPFGEGINKAFTHLLELGEKEGFTTKNLDGFAGHIELKGSGDEVLGILCHVDVVPEGDGWTSDPYRAEIRDGKIFARGAMDDKGPTIAAFYAMKIVKELGVPLSKNVRMIIGTDEESDWRCVDHYFKHEKMPEMGFAPDADFPIIFAEKGIIDLNLEQQLVKKEEAALQLVSFESGRRYNMVPDFAKATVRVNGDVAELEQSFYSYLKNVKINGQVNKLGDEIEFMIEGVSAHAMEPNNGINAGVLLATFLADANLDDNGRAYVMTIKQCFHNDTRGNQIGIAYKDDISGELTVNAGVMHYQEEEIGKIGVNIRYPVTGDSEKIKKGFISIEGFEVTDFNDSPPHHVEENSPLIQTLSKVYEEQTGEKAELIAIGGGTYARSLEAGVAFGPLFPGRPDVAHQKDEYIHIEDLIKATAIYAQAIYELAK
ncbi:dipeptidase PepV [Bacillus weihaiensis]|uniref:Dipeptidase PepV n=1 Tax=Bacillus weihaiensis TaxID=1547283 RepID=A0A1L3MNX3_9BACI|nr:dipeptidase PepV [Bacillus weihaiensis]APH04029.1 dipeptidase PepV [Bacillus weihaiensis]